MLNEWTISWCKNLMIGFEDTPDETYWGRVHNRTTRKAIGQCLTALREKQERDNPEPLTLEQLREMHGEPVWCINKQCNSAQWGIVKVSDSAIRLWGPELIVEISARKGCVPRDSRGRKIAGNYEFYVNKPITEGSNDE